MKKTAAPPTEKQIRAEALAFRWLCRLGPFFGAMSLGSATLYIDWFLPPPGMHRGSWAADYPYLFAVAFSVVIGALLGGAMSDSAEQEVAGRRDNAADTCLRWGVAVAVFLLMSPLANFDDAVRHLGLAYAAMLRNYAPALTVTVLLIVRGLLLMRPEATTRS